MVTDTKTDKQKLQESTWKAYMLSGSKTQKFIESWEPKPDMREAGHIMHCINQAMQELCGIAPCKRFMKAVLANDLRGAIGHADDINSKWLKIYVSWFYNEVPSRLLDFYRNS